MKKLKSKSIHKRHHKKSIRSLEIDFIKYMKTWKGITSNNYNLAQLTFNLKMGSVHILSKSPISTFTCTNIRTQIKAHDIHIGYPLDGYTFPIITITFLYTST